MCIRDRSDAEDYRYFPEPDLVPIAPSREWVEQLRADLPELPAAKKARLSAQWQFSEVDMTSAVNAGALDLLEATVDAGCQPTAARKWWLTELSRRANEAGVDLAEVGMTPCQVAQLQKLVDDGTLTDKLARQVIDGVIAGEGDPQQVVDGRGLAVVSDDAALGLSLIHI